MGEPSTLLEHGMPNVPSTLSRMAKTSALPKKENPALPSEGGVFFSGASSTGAVWKPPLWRGPEQATLGAVWKPPLWRGPQQATLGAV